MAINFGKFFFHNFLPNRNTSEQAENRDTAASSSDNDYEDDEYTEQAHANSGFVLDSQDDKLTQVLESLRRVISIHKAQQQQQQHQDQLKALAEHPPSRTTEGAHSGDAESSISETERLQLHEYQRFPPRKTGLHGNRRFSAAAVLGPRSHHHHQRSLDLGPTLFGKQSFKATERLSRKPEKVSRNAVFAYVL
ncbi:unnamed protein product [Dibothriocephalus latus]|uniref:Uncharacterized protein n=1 Tax=Dibothriocephalus latus TaxID=60516 RepID=A0A3P7Q7R4_DIBLA|nr:unnamed protein product [Dibothriocephalus latus]